MTIAEDEARMARQRMQETFGDGAEAHEAVLSKVRSDNFVISWDSIHLLDEQPIGEGGFGAVFKGRLWGKTVAVKLLHDQGLSRESWSDFRAEVSLLMSLRHPNILLIMGCVLTPPHLSIVTEFCERGSVWHLVVGAKKNRLTFDKRLSFAVDACLGMAYLHQLDIVHADLKIKNLLVDKDWNVKVADFGLASVTHGDIRDVSNHETEKLARIGGTKGYCSPELISAIRNLDQLPAAEQLFTPATDVFAFAVCLYELYCCVSVESHWGKMNSVQFMDALNQGLLRPMLPDHMLLSFKNLIEDCWQNDPKQRPGFIDIQQRLLKIQLSSDRRDAQRENAMPSPSMHRGKNLRSTSLKSW